MLPRGVFCSIWTPRSVWHDKCPKSTNFGSKHCIVSGLKRQFDKWYLFRAPTCIPFLYFQRHPTPPLTRQPASSGTLSPLPNSKYTAYKDPRRPPSISRLRGRKDIVTAQLRRYSGASSAPHEQCEDACTQASKRAQNLSRCRPSLNLSGGNKPPWNDILRERVIRSLAISRIP